MKSPHKDIGSVLICILSSVALASCQQNLTRAEAQSQLDASYKTAAQYERVETGSTFGNSYRPYTVPSGQLRTSLPQEVTALSEAGLLNITVTASGLSENYMNMTGDHVVDHIAITPTEKGKPFFAGFTSDGYINLVSATPTVEILGITEPAESLGKKMCSVSFQVSWSNNQVADILKKQYSVDKKEATFVKYDNGWRLEK